MIDKILQRLDAPKDLITKLTSDDADISDFNEFMESQWISRAVAQDDDDIKNKVTGKVLGVLENKARKVFSFTPAETEGKQLSEVLEMGNTKHQEKLNELQGIIDKSDNSEALTTMQGKLDDITTKFQQKEQTEMDLNKSIEDLKTSHDEELKGRDINLLRNQVIQSISFKDDLSPLESKGFQSEVNDNLKFNLSESNELQVTDKQGEKIQNENKTDYLTPKDALESLANDNKLLKNNNLPADNVRTNTTTVTPPVDNGNVGRPLGKSAQKNSEYLKNASVTTKL